MTASGAPRPPTGLLACALVALALFFAAWPWFGGRSPMLDYTVSGAITFGHADATYYAVVGLVELVCVAALGWTLASRWSAGADARVRELLASPRAAYAALGLLGGLAALAVAIAFVRLHTLTEDEKTYLFQAKLLLSGRLAVPVPPEAGAFWQPFLVGERVQRWSGQYHWGQPALLALGLLAGVPHVVSALEVAVTVFFAGMLGEACTDDRRVGVLGALLVATSPLVVLTGSTLHNANLSAACAMAALWGLVRLARGPSVAATLALGVGTGLALHGRLQEQATLLLGAGVVLALRERRALPALARRLAPAALLVLPFAALLPWLAYGVSGSPWRNGYAMFNQGHGWLTFGFGAGPFGNAHTPAIAGAKTLAALVRVAFYLTGAPLVPLLFAASLALGLEPRRRLASPAVAVALYGAVYFFYAGTSIHGTGPVYYAALAPVLCVWAAALAVALHDRWLAPRAATRRAVPAVVVATLAVSATVFVPPLLLELGRASDAASQCERLVESRGITRALVFVRPGTERGRAWTDWIPMPSPDFDDAVLYANSDSALRDAPVARRFGEGRAIYLAQCLRRKEPTLEPYDPFAQAVDARESGATP